jgi:hypothetical protein
MSRRAEKVSSTRNGTSGVACAMARSCGDRSPPSGGGSPGRPPPTERALSLLRGTRPDLRQCAAQNPLIFNGDHAMTTGKVFAVLAEGAA